MFPKILVLTLLTALPLFAFSFEEGPEAKTFHEDAAAYSEHCSTEGTCTDPFRNQVIFSHSGQVNKISATTKDVLSKISFDQAQIWGDTILEGDFIANGETRLDKVLALTKEGRLIGYKIQYSEKAWYVGDCDYDGSEESLSQCGNGRISESSFVSADFLTFFTDENELANFAFDSSFSL